MKKAAKWVLCIFSFVYGIDLIILLKMTEDHVPGCLESVGLPSVNMFFRNLFDYGSSGGYFRLPYLISEVLGIISLIICFFWVGLAISDAIKNGSIDRMDKTYFSTVCLYILGVITRKILVSLNINYAPATVSEKSALIVSFPCGNVFLIIFSMCSSFYLVGYCLEEKKRIVLILRIVCMIILVLGLITGLVSGVYWLTDIAGAICFAVPALVIYSFFCDV